MIRMRIEARQVRRHVGVARPTGLHTISRRHQRVGIGQRQDVVGIRGSPSTWRLRCSPGSTRRRACSCRTGRTDRCGSFRSDPVPDCGTSRRTRIGQVVAHVAVGTTGLAVDRSTGRRLLASPRPVRSPSHARSACRRSSMNRWQAPHVSATCVALRRDSGFSAFRIPWAPWQLAHTAVLMSPDFSSPCPCTLVRYSSHAVSWQCPHVSTWFWTNTGELHIVHACASGGDLPSGKPCNSARRRLPAHSFHRPRSCGRSPAVSAALRRGSVRRC